MQCIDAFENVGQDMQCLLPIETHNNDHVIKYGCH